MTPLDPISALPDEWRTQLAKHELVPVTAGMSGAFVFRILAPDAGDQYLKIATGSDADHLRRETERTKWLASMGIRVPAVLRQFDGKNTFAIVMTALSGVRAESTYPDDWRPIVTAIARAFAALHALPAAACPFDETLSVKLARARELIRQGAIDVTQFDARNIGVAPEALYERLAAGIPAQEDCVVVHGDATLSNLICADDGKIGFIDCGNCGKSDRYVDLALLVGDIADRFGDEARLIFLHAYGALQWDERKVEFYRDLYELF